MFTKKACFYTVPGETNMPVYLFFVHINPFTPEFDSKVSSESQQFS